MKEFDANALLKNIYTNVPFGIFICDVNGKLIYSNTWLQDNLEISPENFCKNLWEKYILTEDHEKFIAAIQNENALDLSKVDIKIKLKENDFAWIEIETQPMYVEGEKYAGKIGIVLDKTASKTADLLKGEAIIELEKFKKIKRDFLANVNHELRTPLNGIFGIVGLMQSTELSELQKKYLGIIQESSESLLSAINSILKFADFDKDDIDLNLSPCNIVTEIGKIINSYADRLCEKGLDLFFNSFWKNEAVILADGFKLSQALESLISNAIKFTNKGYVKIKIDSSLESEDTVRLTFSVIDTGIGIAESKLDRIFLPFTQIDEPSSRKHAGIGLGLSSAKKIIEAMGGKIAVKSNVDEGSTFSFSLSFPFHEKNAGIIDDLDLLKDISTYVISDDDEFALCLKEQLKYWSMKPNAVSFEKALETIRSESNDAISYKLILIDSNIDSAEKEVFMSKLNEIAGNYQTVPKIVIYPRKDRNQISGFVDIGVSCCLEKPVLPSNLLGTVKRVLEDLSFSKTDEPACFSISESTSKELHKPLKAKVLLVEDDLMNQQVVEAVLNKLGCTVEVVGNGKEAILITSRLDFDLIFMDLQMPEMDGFETCRAIRKYELGKKYTPIIAFTAYIYKEEMQKCIESGMDDYLLKPVTMESFRLILAKWTFQELEFREFPVFDPQKAKDTVGGNVEILNKASKVFFEDMKQRFSELKQLIDSRNMSEVERLAHTLKSGSSYLGAERMRALSFYLENAAVKKEYGIITALFYKLKPELETFKKAIAGYDWSKKE